MTPTLSRDLEKLLAKIGIQRLHKNGKIGPCELEPRAFDAGPTWEDYLASNPSLPDDQVRRVRIYLPELGATKEAREPTRRWRSWARTCCTRRCTWRRRRSGTATPNQRPCAAARRFANDLGMRSAVSCGRLAA